MVGRMSNTALSLTVPLEAAERPRLPKVTHVSRVQQVEHAVREHNRLPFAVRASGDRNGIRTIEQSTSHFRRRRRWRA